MNQQEIFINAIAPAAVESWKRAGIPASFTIAQASLESGWGRSKLAREARNLFGVKAGSNWKGDKLVLMTTEYADLDGDGQKDDAYQVPAQWRKYANFAECIADREKVLTSLPRYAPAFVRGHDIDGASFCQLIVAGGYATDPNYVVKIQQIINKYNLNKYDILKGA